MKMIFRPLALLFAAVVLSSTAYAAGQDNPREACRDDVHSFCSDVKPGSGRIIDCLKDHYKEISDRCYAALQKIQAHGEGHGSNGAAPPRGGNEDEQTDSGSAD